MASLLALLSAVAYGTGDFLGGLSARRLPVGAVVWRTHVIGLLGLLLVAPLVSSDDVGGRDLWLGSLAGVAGGVGILLLYLGLSRGTMSVVAPVTAVLAAAVPAGWGLVRGERPSALALAGVVVGIVAIVLVAREPDTVRIETSLLAIALGAGLGFGLFFVALDATGDDAGLWPIVSGRATSAAIFVVVAAALPSYRVGSDAARRGTTPWLLVGTGVLDAAANAFFLLATQTGLLTLVAVLGALYPAATVVLARIVLAERLAPPQVVGCVLAVTAAAMVAGG